MNFLKRSTTYVAEEEPPGRNSLANSPTPSHFSTLEELITKDRCKQNFRVDDCSEEDDGFGGENGNVDGSSSKNDSPVSAKHSDVSAEEGWITIPNKELPENWDQATDIHALRSLDRPFVFPGEQVHILACLSARKQDTEIITPFKVAAVMSKKGMSQTPEEENRNSPSKDSEATPDNQQMSKYNVSKVKSDTKHRRDVSSSESFLIMQDRKRQTEKLLQKFENSNFFVRIAESDEQLWSKQIASNKSSANAETYNQKSSTIGMSETAKDMSLSSAVIDRGNVDATVSNGAARNSFKCSALPNGDIVVLLQVNVGVDIVEDPFIEILEFEKHQHDSICSDQDPCGELLRWLVPLDNSLPSVTPLFPPPLSSNTATGTPQRSQQFASSGSQLISLGHFRSYSMSAIPQTTTSRIAPVKVPSSKPRFELEDWDQSSLKLLMKKSGVENLLSFRGVQLEREIFSVQCGLEGSYIPGRRWTRKLEIIQPVKIHSFAADCNTDDLLCVQIKNIAPDHAPDIVVYIDAITVVFDEVPKKGQPSSLPIVCIEAGKDHFLPDLSLRRGEEHSFVMKPATAMQKNLKDHCESSSQSSKLQIGAAKYAIMVSCRCNYTESRLFFKQPTTWKPRVLRDIIVSVSSEMSEQSRRHDERNSQSPMQVLTLQASNLTSEDLTMTVLAPASFSSPLSVVSLNSSPTSPMSPFIGFPEFAGRVNGEKEGSGIRSQSSISVVTKKQKRNADNKHCTASLDGQNFSVSNIVPSGLGCTHTWLPSRVPLGRIPSQSMATLKLELLPLTNGIITLDTLQIDVKEKGLIYIPERSLKIMQHQASVEGSAREK